MEKLQASMDGDENLLDKTLIIYGSPMANVMLTLMQKLGLDDMTTFGDSTGAFSLSG